MFKSLLSGCLCILCQLLCLPVASAFDWEVATPESQGMSSELLDSLHQRNVDLTRALLVIRNDRIVGEWYAEGVTPQMRQGTASLAKAIVGGLSLAVALDDHLIELDDPAAKYVRAWQADSQKSRITVRQLGSHTSGIEDSHNWAEEARGIDQRKYTGWAGDFWRWSANKPAPPGDAFSISRDLAPVLFEPGSEFHYSNPGIGMLNYCVTASLVGQPQADIRSLLRERIMRPIGVSDNEWSCGYGITQSLDGLPLVASWGGGSYTPRAAARIGRLLWRDGDWDGQKLLSSASIKSTTSHAGLPGHCGMGWWTNHDGRYALLPRDAYWGAGAGHQILLVVPSLNLIAVRNGNTFPKDAAATLGTDDDALYQSLFEPLMKAVLTKADATSQAPYPPSRLITSVQWAPSESIVRRAKGCDNWPLTWTDDDVLFGAYGDGTGFEPPVPQKLSMGLARISGGPTDFQGLNLRSPSIETYGNDSRGGKASGVLMVEKVLYMWVRNTNNSRLAWSSDGGVNWEWAQWRFETSFGCPTFLNFGPNYAGARDNYVYIYSHDSDSAYTAADRMVLARVDQHRILERSAYEYFQALDSQGRATWTSDISQRGAVFDHVGRCYRSGITYCAALKRYLWCQIYPESNDGRGPRFQGGFGVFDAPEPWGPWSTVYSTNAWDVGPSESSSFPTKWMSEDGKTMHLVFSGDDYFSVRKVQWTLSE